MASKTIKEIEKLKKNWLADPCWDIEDTEGFEDYYDELLAYRKKQELVWANERELYNNHYPLCPMKFASNNIGSCKCERGNCAWWNSEYSKCGIILEGFLQGWNKQFRERLAEGEARRRAGGW